MTTHSTEPGNETQQLTVKRSGKSNKPPFAAAGMMALMVVCCAGPALLAAGTLAAIGGALRNPWAIAAAGLLAYFAFALTARRWPRRNGKSSTTTSCCSPRSAAASGRTTHEQSPDHR